MAIPAQNVVSNNKSVSYPPSATGPAAQVRSRPLLSEDAASVLKLVDVDGRPLDVEALGKDTPALTRIAAEIIRVKKNGGNIEFENGRIRIPKETFDSVIRTAEKVPALPEQIITEKKSGQKETVPQTQAKNIGKNALPQHDGIFAPPPPVVDVKSRKFRKRSSPGAAQSVDNISDEDDEDSAFSISVFQAYSILIDILSPTGGRYIMHMSGEYEDSEERRKELEKALEEFWKDFGQTHSINGRHTSFVIKPKILIDNQINQDVSKKLVIVYLSQSTEEKIKQGKITISYEAVTIKSRRGERVVEIHSKKLVGELTEIVNKKTGSKETEIVAETPVSLPGNPFLRPMKNLPVLGFN